MNIIRHLLQWNNQGITVYHPHDHRTKGLIVRLIWSVCPTGDLKWQKCGFDWFKKSPQYHYVYDLYNGQGTEAAYQLVYTVIIKVLMISRLGKTLKL
jgi:hypothetical protein